MAYMTFPEQVASPLTFLRDRGLDVETLQVDAGFVRCHSIDEEGSGKRGEYAYKTEKKKLEKPGMAGLVTWCRGSGGHEKTHKTYGQDGKIAACALPLPKKSDPAMFAPSEDVGSKARRLWDQAKESGRSDYLEAKGVGAYGIRFLENEYGSVAVVPLHDLRGYLWTLQFLNPDGSKRFLKGSEPMGLFHKLREPKSGQDIGIAESYVTAASCLELSGIPMVNAFSSSNVPIVASVIRENYPKSRIIIFGDNDRHLEENTGRKYAEKAVSSISNCISAFPDFGDIPPSKEASDWNDLVRLKGVEVAKHQIMSFIS